MYVHLGENTAIRTKNIIAIVDIDNITVSKNAKDFLNKAEKEGIVVNITEELPKSAIICEEKGKRTVYISQLAPVTLQKRINSASRHKA